MDNGQISKEDINRLPLYSFDGPIRLVRSDAEVESAIAELAGETLLGFDTETKPVFVKGVSHPPALLQLAGEKRVTIFQLQRLTHLDPLVRLLEDVRVTKAGVALADDLKKLVETFPFQPAGFEEIANHCKVLGLKQTGLRPLTAMLFGYRISKREQRSNWAREDLTPSQITYAATDAWMSRELCIALRRLVAEHAAQAVTPPDGLT